MAMELIDIFLTESAHSHIEHLYIDVVIAFIGIIDLLSLFRVIWSPFYPPLCGVLWTFVGVFFTVHKQDNSLGLYMHWLNMLILSAMSFMWLGVVFVAFSSTTHAERSEVLGFSCCFWRGKSVADLNPVYTHPDIFRSPFYAGLGWFGMLKGLWWFQMGFSLFRDNSASLVPHSAVPHTAVILLGRCLLYNTAIALVVTEVVRKIDGGGKQTLSP